MRKKKNKQKQQQGEIKADFTKPGWIVNTPQGKGRTIAGTGKIMGMIPVWLEKKNGEFDKRMSLFKNEEIKFDHIINCEIS